MAISGEQYPLTDSNPLSTGTVPPPVFIHFDDNRLLPSLYGQHDEYLSRIEERLGVSLASRGNQLVISGSPEAVNQAKQVLSFLYNRLKKGLDIDSQEVDAEIRMATEARQGSLTQAAPAVPRDLSGVKTQRRLIAPRSPNQTRYLQALRDFDLSFGIGPAGTGKTYLAVAAAVELLLAGRVDRILLSRPAVEAGERLGFLPGDLREKIDPYLRPLYDALYDMIPPEQVVKRLSAGEIEIAPLAFMRGRTLNNAFVILDEAQNTTPLQMKMFLTRLGENSRMAVTGDLTQIDLPSGMHSGLSEAIHTLHRVEGVSVTEFDKADVIRHPLVARIVSAYEAAGSPSQRERGSAGPDQSPSNPSHDSIR